MSEHEQGMPTGQPESADESSLPVADEAVAAAAAEGPPGEPADEAGAAGRDVAGTDEVGTDEGGEPAAEPEPVNFKWYVLKVQSNREESIKAGLIRRAKMAGLDRYFGEIIVPTELVTFFKDGKKRTKKEKLYPGYIFVQMDMNDDSWFLVRETPGIGDFTGSGNRPAPMLDREIAPFLAKPTDEADTKPRLELKVKSGDAVKIKEGHFENFEGVVDTIDASNGRVTVMINIFGRSTPVEFEYWQVEAT